MLLIANNTNWNRSVDSQPRQDARPSETFSTSAPSAFVAVVLGFSLSPSKKKFEKKKKNKKEIHLAETCGEPHRRTAPTTTHTEHYNIVHVGTDTAHHARIERSWIIIIKAITDSFWRAPKKINSTKLLGHLYIAVCVIFFGFFIISFSLGEEGGGDTGNCWYWSVVLRLTVAWLVAQH